jgi:hypothetical protein
MTVAAAANDDHTVTAAQRLGHMRSWLRQIVQRMNNVSPA